MNKILIDSGPLIALFDRSDKYHDKSVDFIRNNKSVLVTTLASLTETLHLLDFNRNAQIDFLNWINSGAVQLENIEIVDLVRIQALIVKYSDLPMDFADACLVFLGEKLEVNKVATIDRDFDIYRMNGKDYFLTVLK